MGVANGNVPRIGTPQNDTSWAGWAISSFTNKLATANGEIQPKSNGTQIIPRAGRPHVPPTLDSSRPIFPAASASTTLHRQALSKPSPPVLTRTPTDQFFGDAQAEDDEVDDAWGEMEEDSFFDAPSEATPAIVPKPFEDGGEPDFGAWLSAQARPKAPLPKGLTKTLPLSNGRQAVARSTTTGSLGPGAGAKKLASTTVTSNRNHVSAKVIDTKPKEIVADDDWGDAWD